MVTKRSSGSNADLFSRKAEEYFTDIYGRTDITLIQEVETKNSAGRVSGISTTTTTIIGDLQFDSKLMAEYISLGVAQAGDAIFYCMGTSSVVVHNKILVDNVKWELVEQVEGETIQTTVPYKGFIARRIPDA